MARPRVRGASALLLVPLAFASHAARADEPLPSPSPSSLRVDATPTSTTLGPGEALALALEANPALHATLRDRAAARASAEAAPAARMPTLVASGSGSVNETFAGTAAGAVRTRTSTITESVGLRYTTPVGTVVSVDLTGTTQWREVNRDPSTTTLFLIGPTHAAQATVGARQPLLRGGGRDAAQATERRAIARADAAAFDAEQATSQLVVDVLAAYWELWRAERSLEVERTAAALAERQLLDAQRRQSLGTLASADVLRFATERAARAQAVSVATTNVVARGLELARLLGATGTPPSFATAQAAPDAPAAPTLATSIAELARRSPALASLESEVAAARAEYDAAADAARARLDLTGSAGVAGLWIEDAYQGLALPGGRPAIAASVGLELELPLVADVTRARRAGARATLEAAELRLASERARLEVEVATAYAELEGACARVTLASETADLATQAAEAERGRNLLGTSTPTALLEAQQNERTSRLDALSARVDAELASVRIAHRAGALLDRFSLVVPDGGSR